MSSTTAKSAFWQGLRAGAPFLLVVVPFAVLFGVVATEAGLNIAEVMGFSVLVIAGAAQFTAIQLMIENAPVWTVLAASLGVNLRMAMYSASLQPHLGSAPLWQRAFIAYTNFDQSYAVSIVKYEEAPEWSVPRKAAYFCGAVSVIMPSWYAFTFVGAMTGEAIPDSLALDFAMPILFLAMVAPMLKTLAHLAAAIASVGFALLLAFLPSGIGLLFAALAAMAVGAEVERRMRRP